MNHKSLLKDFTYLKRINIVLSILIILVSSYLILSPIVSRARFLYAQEINKIVDYTRFNYLKIESIGVNGIIHEGESEETLLYGLWRRPNTMDPVRGGNTVIAAHRYLHTEGPITFYNLDKVKIGDKAEIIWKEKKYVYEVFETLEVNDRAVDIEQNTDQNILTLYTCTPLWTSEKRLVVKAKLLYIQN